MEDNDYGENYEQNDTEILQEDDNDEIGDEEAVQDLSPRKRRHRRNSRKYDGGSSDYAHGAYRRHDSEDGGRSHKKHRHKSRSSHGGNHRTSIDVSNNHIVKHDSNEMPSDPADVEDGEILEDGEIPDEVGDADAPIEDDKSETVLPVSSELSIQSCFGKLFLLL